LRFVHAMRPGAQKQFTAGKKFEGQRQMLMTGSTDQEIGAPT